MHPKVSIIILNWNGWEDTLECLESLYRISYQNFNVIIVDNGSTDDSIEEIKKHGLNEDHLRSESNYNKLCEYEESDFSNIINIEGINFNKELILLKNSKNYGYAKGNNIGMKFVLKTLNPDYILLLNNDTVVTKSFLKELIKATKNQEKVGIFSPKLLNFDDHKIIDSTGHIFHFGRIIDRGYGKIDKHQYDHKNHIIGAKGAAALYKREMLDSIGLFEESYITSYEDAELSWRANINSWRAIYVPNSIVYHKGERSIKKDSSKFSYFWGLSLRNMTMTVRQYGSLNQKVSFTFLLIYFMIGSFILRILGKRNYGINHINLIKKLYDY